MLEARADASPGRGSEMAKQVLLVVGFLLAIGVAATLIAGPAKSQKLSFPRDSSSVGVLALRPSSASSLLAGSAASARAE